MFLGGRAGGQRAKGMTERSEDVLEEVTLPCPGLGPSVPPPAYGSRGLRGGRARRRVGRRARSRGRGSSAPACPTTAWPQGSATLRCAGQCNGSVNKSICYFYPGRKQTAARTAADSVLGTTYKLQAVTSMVLIECACPSSF